MQLIVAEKPSVARDLARVLGVRGGGRHAIEGAGRVITWCIGHLVELEEPAAYDARWKPWRLETLPMIPAAFKLRSVVQTRDQLRAVSGLLKDRRFTEVVNACDAGREGELIFRYLYELAGSRLAVRRLWISSLTDEAIRGGFAALRAGRDYDPLADAARCRSEADWLVGMNATRALTIRSRVGTARPAAPAYGRRGRRGGPADAGSPLYSVGRVQTPTLAIVVRREEEIRAFQPRDYWEIRATFRTGGAGVGSGAGVGEGGPAPVASAPASFTATWGVVQVGGPGAKDAEDAKETKETKETKRASRRTRLGGGPLAEQLVARNLAHAGAVDPEGPVVERLRQRRVHEPPPLLFDLTSLQRTANRRFGLSAAQTLAVGQALYERHKVITYPRTDARHLPQDVAATLPAIFRALGELPDYAEHVAPLLAGPPPRPRRVFDDAKIHDHHAIIPTGKAVRWEALARDERRILDLIVRRFLGVFHPDAELAVTDVVVRVGDGGGDGRDDAGGAAVGRGAASRGDDGADGQRGVGAGRGDGSAAAGRGAASAGAGAPPPPADEAAAPDEALLEALPPPPDRFFARGRVRLVAGWQAVAQIGDRPAGSESQAALEGEQRLPVLREGQRLDGGFEALAKQTRPPPRHNEATLLGAMEYAGRDIEDEALRAAMRDTGLGTPATRAATIETLLKRKFVVRDGKHLVPTEMGIALIHALPVASLASPELTGAWEARLARVARAQEPRAAFMADIARYVAEVVQAIRGNGAAALAARGAGDLAPSRVAESPAAPSPAAPRFGSPRQSSPPASPARRAPARPAPAPAPPAAPSRPAPPAAGAPQCPRCRQGTLMAGKRGWGCSRWREGCGLVIWFEVADHRISPAELRDLVEKGRTRRRKWPRPGAAPTASGRLVLDLAATREAGAARFEPA
jgi:DNA topoisomerase-3